MLAYRFTDRLADLTTNVSDDGARRFVTLKAVPASKIKVLSNGIDINRFKFSDHARAVTRGQFGIGQDTHVFLAVGRFVPEKDFPNLLNAFSKLLTKSCSCVLLIAGDGELLSYCRRLAEQLQIVDYVRFLGLRKDIPSLLSACDTFVLASHTEGLPLVVGEAMATSRVVVATDAGGVREIVGECGFIVPSRQSHALCGAMEKAMELKSDERSKLEQRAREHIESKHSLDSLATQWLQLYSAETV